MQRFNSAQLQTNLVFKKWSNKSYAVFSSLNKVIKIGTLCFAYTMLNISLVEVFAQQDTVQVEKDEEIEELVVVEEVMPGVHADMARFVSVLSKNEISRSPSLSINQQLETSTSLDIRQRGKFGVQADLNIRGGSFDQNMVLLNGINISDPQTGHFSLNIPISYAHIKRIEILKGPGARFYGPNAFSGAVNFITAPYDTSQIYAAITGGQYGLFNADLSGTIKHDKHKSFVALSSKAANGHTHNTGFDSYYAYYKGDYQFNNVGVETQLGYNDKKFGANKFYSFRFPDQYEENNIKIASLRITTGSDIKTSSAVYWRRHKDHFVLIRDDPGVYQNYHRTDIFGGDFHAALYSSFGKSAIGISLRSEQILSNNLGVERKIHIDIPHSDSTYHKDYVRNTISTSFEHRVKIKNFYASVGGMFYNDMNNRGLMGLYPGGEIAYQPDNKWNLYISINSSLRLPTFTDLFYKGRERIGNINLHPEKIVAYECGMKYRNGYMNFRIAGFRNNGRNIIDWIKYDDDQIFKANNIAAIKTNGAEVTGNIDIESILKRRFLLKGIKLSYLYQNNRKADGNFESLYAYDNLNHKFTGIIHFRIDQSFSVVWSSIFQDRNGSFLKYKPTSDSFKTFVYKPFWTYSLDFQWQFKQYCFSAGIDNIFDEKYYDIGNVRQPGRWITAGVSVNFIL